METLKEYFLSNNDYSNLPNIFSNLSRQLKIIHDNGMVIPLLNSDKIAVDNGEFSFQYMTEANNYELEKRKNITSFAKLILGTYLSLSTNFNDFSSVDDNWFSQNIDSILNSITADNFDKEYFDEVFKDGEDTYYSDFLDRKRQSEELGGKGNVNAYSKVLKNSASAFYSSSDTEQNEEGSRKSASINYLFYPVALLCFTVALLLTMVALNYFIN